MTTHIAPGPSAGGCLKTALQLPPAAILVNQDVLSCGPLPPLRSLDEWRSVREDYLRILRPDMPDFQFADFPPDLLTNAESLKTANSIVLWIGTGLAEQLLLAWTVELLHLLGVELSKLSVIQFTYSPRGHEIVSIGMLNPEHLAAHPAPTLLDDEALRELATVWAAVTAAEPDALSALVGETRRPLPLLHRSLAGMIARYPDSRTGLNAWEMQLLRYVETVGANAARVIGNTLAHDMDYPDWVGDDYLLYRLRRLGDPGIPHPLVTLTGDADDLRQIEARLTARGEDVLARRANFVDLNGIDDWVGGVHLDSAAGRVWFNQDGRLVRAS